MIDALWKPAQVLVTGDIDYHTAIDALAQGLYIIDAGHYGTEYGFITFMAKKLEKLFPELIVTERRSVSRIRSYPEEEREMAETYVKVTTEWKAGFSGGHTLMERSCGSCAGTYRRRC